VVRRQVDAGEACFMKPCLFLAMYTLWQVCGGVAVRMGVVHV